MSNNIQVILNKLNTENKESLINAINEVNQGFTNVKSNIEDLTTNLAQITQDSSITVTVGTNGDYSTINNALAFLSRKKLKYNRNIKAEIKLLTGFIMQEQVIIKGLDLGWIKITAEDSIVPISRSALTSTITFPTYDNRTSAVNTKGAFIGYDNAILPVIACLFNMDTTGTSETIKDAFFVCNNSKLLIEKGAGCTNANGKGIYAAQNSTVSAAGAIITNAGGNGISCFRQSYVYFRGGNASGAVSYGVYADSNSKVEAITANFSNAGGTGVYADSVSTISCPSAIVSGCGVGGIAATGASIIDARESNIDNATQRGVYASGGARINVANSSIKNAGTQAITVDSAGFVNADSSDCSGAVGRGLNALNGGIIVAKSVNAQKGMNPSTDDIRVSSGGIIIAHDAIGGLGGVSYPNVFNKEGLIANRNASGYVGNLTSRCVWGSSNGNYAESSMIPLDDANNKTITLTRINLLGTSDLTTEELAKVEILKINNAFSLRVSNDSALATKLSQKSTMVVATIG